MILHLVDGRTSASSALTENIRALLCAENPEGPIHCSQARLRAAAYRPFLPEAKAKHLAARSKN